jgi:multisubunit Na+/H+ antiporter MnhG subunit
MRAFWLPVAGVVAVVVIAWLAATVAAAHRPLPLEVVVAALTAITTLTASAAAHAAGHAATQSKRSPDDGTSGSGQDSKGQTPL